MFNWCDRTVMYGARICSTLLFAILCYVMQINCKHAIGRKLRRVFSLFLWRSCSEPIHQDWLFPMLPLKAWIWCTSPCRGCYPHALGKADRNSRFFRPCCRLNYFLLGRAFWFPCVRRTPARVFEYSGEVADAFRYLRVRHLLGNFIIGLRYISETV